MIYSKDHNFLLLKNIKVGGTSVEVAMSQVVPDSAIVTPINPNNLNHRPKNYKGLKSHASYEEISKFIDLSNVKTYIITRNPYYMVLSNFFWILNQMKVNWNSLNNEQKQEYVDSLFIDYENTEDVNIFPMPKFSRLRSTKYLYTFNEKIMIDKFIRYEDGLENQINSILESHNITKINLNVFEKKHRPEDIHPSNIFSDDQMNIIAQEWKWEFDNLGYNK
jgi:hypothetical protein